MKSRELMLHRIIDALNSNVHGLLTGKTHSIIHDERANSDLRFASYEELQILLDNDDEMDRVHNFFTSLQEMNGYEYADKKHPQTIEDYPNVCRYLRISVYC